MLGDGFILEISIEPFGTWQFTNDSATQLTLDTGEEITVIELALIRFEFGFVNNGYGGSATGTGGSYLVVLGKQ